MVRILAFTSKIFGEDTMTEEVLSQYREYPPLNLLAQAYIDFFPTSASDHSTETHSAPTREGNSDIGNGDKCQVMLLSCLWNADNPDETCQKKSGLGHPACECFLSIRRHERGSWHWFDYENKTVCQKTLLLSSDGRKD
ncbi:unnamed protein product [Protopolystoma xenopodis]|uniref:Uncharacterized protein n=1 Tax=Protopolystoma xenopodis TaxID=117903 RepID=A0A3S5CKW0_9PLAT|nr:unnamed protein product [Protopolystoma xenopodis]